MLEIAIVDDESGMIDELSQKVTQYLGSRSVPYRVSPFENGRDFMAHRQAFDLIFLDIQMEGLSGMDVARALRQGGAKSVIIFVTALQEYVYDAFEVEASDYLLKPIDDARFSRTMERACCRLQPASQKGLLITSRGNTCKLLPYREICYCEAKNHKIEIHTEGAVHVCGLKMGELGKQLDSRFFLCHRSYYVNLDFVVGYADGQAVLANGEEVPVSRLRGQAFARAVLRHMKGDR